MSIPIGFHLRMRLREDRILTPDTASQRRAAAVLLRLSQQFAVLGFRFSDTHLHLVTLLSEEATLELARRIAIGLQRSMKYGLPFSYPKLKVIEHTWHLQNAFFYVLGQDRRHEFHHDPLAEASNLPDLLGLRVSGGVTIARVRAQLPRLQRTDLLSVYGIDDLSPMWTDASPLAEAAAATSTLVDPKAVPAQCSMPGARPCRLRLPSCAATRSPACSACTGAASRAWLRSPQAQLC